MFDAQDTPAQHKPTSLAKCKHPIRLYHPGVLAEARLMTGNRKSGRVPEDSLVAADAGFVEQE